MSELLYVRLSSLTVNRTKFRLESLTYNSFSEFQLAFPRRAGIGKLRPSISVQHVEGAVAVVTIDSDSRTVGFSLRTGYYLCHCSLAAYGGAGNWPEILALGDSLHPLSVRRIPRICRHAEEHGDRRLPRHRDDRQRPDRRQTALIRHGLFPGWCISALPMRPTPFILRSEPC